MHGRYLIVVLYLLSGPASLNSLYVISTLMTNGMHASTVQHFKMSFAPYDRAMLDARFSLL